MIFIDTGAFLGRYLAQDQHHDEAVRGWSARAQSREPLVTSNFVLDEFFTLLARRAGYAFAAERARRVYASTTLTLLRPTEPDELSALDSFEKYADQGVSFTDCVSFALMTRLGIDRVFTFDRHFRWAGFTVVP